MRKIYVIDIVVYSGSHTKESIVNTYMNKDLKGAME